MSGRVARNHLLMHNADHKIRNIYQKLFVIVKILQCF